VAVFRYYWIVFDVRVPQGPSYEKGEESGYYKCKNEYENAGLNVTQVTTLLYIIFIFFKY
jgi:hypothetical protein